MKRRILKYQLQRTGASNKEARELLDVAHKITESSSQTLSESSRSRITAQLPASVEKQPKTRLYVALGAPAAVFVLLVGIAQIAPTTSPLYNLKRGTDFIRGLWSSPKNTTPDKPETIEKIQANDIPAKGELPKVEEPSPEKSPQHSSGDVRKDRDSSDRFKNEREQRRQRRENESNARRENNRRRHEWR